ncbi:MAG TPA: aldehyde dehydrogenase family protein [Bacteroidia bacterium]|jgi:acyl-CoA reductase-like NAD-dependent aldehyde dehydrogenase|nr:aldehyde dehydrogenase family protein [Bacteroidia bacterium]
MLDYPIYVAGELQSSPLLLNVTNPYTGEVFARTYNATQGQYEEAVKRALAVKKQMAEMPAFERYKALRYISDTITATRQHLAEILCAESGKPMHYALGEVDRAAQTFLIAAEEAKRLPKEYISIDWTPSGAKKEGMVKYFPVGIVAGITPFNFPINLVAHKVAPALAAGCPIILKPASSVPLSSLELAKIIAHTSYPKGAFSVLPMDRKNGNQLVTDERINLLSFTGSDVVGWEMKKNAGKKKVVLELGGNAAVIISSSADLQDACKKALVAGFSYSGQVCIHAQRFYIHHDLFEKFASEFIQSVETLQFGDPKDPSTDVSVMIDQANADRVETWVNEAVKQGAKVLCGGKKKGGFYEPTVLTHVREEMKVCSEEIFGPVVTFEKFTTFEEAVDKVNSARFGLQASVFTNSIIEMETAFNQLEVGGVVINDMPTFRADHMPYGGIKDSGLGREGVRYAIMEMMEPRILIK